MRKHEMQLEFTKDIFVKQTYDVLVAGGGPAGICAAVAAAREGAKVALVERYGILGGNLTVGHVGPILGVVGEGSIRHELMALLGVPDNDELGVVGVAHDMEKAKIVIAKFVHSSGVDVYLQSPIADVIKEGNRISGVIIAGKQGMYALGAKAVVDCTGDGDVAFFSGAPYEIGRKEDGKMQPVTLEFILDNVDESRAITCIGEVDDVQYKGQSFLEYTKECCQKGYLPEHLASVRLHRTVTPGQRCVNTTQANGIDATDVTHFMHAEVELRHQIELVTNFLREHVEGYENCRIISSAVTLGTRETRRIMGEYLLTSADLIAGRKFEDVVVHDACFIIDIHNPTGAGQASGGAPESAVPYDIPYRSLVPLAIDGLLVAGRCISGTHRAHASYRVMSICMAMGQAAGVAAALCAAEDTVARKLDVKKVQHTLERQGVKLKG